MQGTGEKAPTADRTSRRSPLAAFFLSAVIAAITVFAVPSGPASADPPTASGYLSWETPSPGPCPQNGWQALEDLSFEPSLHSQRIYAGTSKSENLETRKWVDNGVSRARKFDACRDGKPIFFYAPLEYQHREYQQEWTCAQLGCRYNFDHTSDWSPGTEFPPSPCPGPNC
jgi:hypothetical protein